MQKTNININTKSEINYGTKFVDKTILKAIFIINKVINITYIINKYKISSPADNIHGNK